MSPAGSGSGRDPGARPGRGPQGQGPFGASGAGRDPHLDADDVHDLVQDLADEQEPMPDPGAPTVRTGTQAFDGAGPSGGMRGARGRGRNAGRETASDPWADRAQEIYRDILRRAPEHDFDPTLERVRRACDLLGDPQRAYRVVHVAGTNGKTSTARMIETLVREHGLRTGLFTSPHLTDVRERIQIDGVPVDAETFCRVWEEIAPIVTMVDAESQASGGPITSFFEVFTLMAFAAFADAPVDVAVIEVGMGGRWDATNVVDSQVQVIAPVSRDHEQWLGHTLQAIAGEKAGVLRGTRGSLGDADEVGSGHGRVRPAPWEDEALRWEAAGPRGNGGRDGDGPWGSVGGPDADPRGNGGGSWASGGGPGHDRPGGRPEADGGTGRSVGAVIGPQREEVEAVLGAVVERLGVHAVWAGRDIEVLSRLVAVGGQMLDLRGIGGVYPEVFLPLFGAHQADNALLALAACELLLQEGGALDPATVRQGFAAVTSPGRLEIARTGPTVLVDAAHNPGGIEALATAVEDSFAFTRLIGVFGVMADKDPETMLGLLEPVLDRIVITRSTSLRSMEPEELGAIARGVFDPDRVEVVDRLDDALALAIDWVQAQDEPGGGVLACGSVVLAGEVRVLLGA